MKIPVGNFGQAVADPQQAANLPAGAADTATAREVQGIAAQVGGIGQKIQERADLAATMEAEKRLADWQMGALYDPENGALALQGKAAFGAARATLGQFDKESGAILSTLSNDRQRNAFKQLALSRRMQIHGQLAAHERTQADAYEKGEIKGLLQTSVQAAALQFGDPQAVQQEVRRSVGALSAFASAQGWSESQTKAAVQAQVSEIHSAVAERIIQADPSRGVEYVQQNMAQFSAAEGARLQKVATNTMESKLRLALAYEERAERVRQRQDRAIAKQTAMQGDVLLSQGSLSADWIERNRDRLTPEDHRYFYGKLEGSQERTDPLIYTSLRSRVALGEDISDDARESLQLGLLKLDDFNRLTEIQGRSTIAGGVPPVYKRGVTYIRDSLRVSDLNPDPAAAQRQASALNDWDDYLQANPKASDREAQQEYQRIVEEYALADTRETSLMLRMPRHAVGGRRDMNIEATSRATVEAFLEKHGGNRDAVLADREYQQQSLLIEKWKEISVKAEAKRADNQQDGGRNERRK